MKDEDDRRRGDDVSLHQTILNIVSLGPGQDIVKVKFVFVEWVEM